MASARIKDATKDRYHALSINPTWSLDTLRRTWALIVGGGALGNEAVKNLAMMGVRGIVIVDRDKVEVANLSRSIFFRESDHGRLKSEVLAERIRDFNPDVQVIPMSGDLEEVIGLGLVRRMDLILSCLDNRLARRALNRMCQKVGKPWVDGAMENLTGEVSVYMPDSGPCYECTLTSVDQEIIAQATSCKGLALKSIALGKVPTTSTMGSIVAAVQVQEALKVLHGQLNGSLAGKRLVINGLIDEFYTTQSDRKDDCMGHFRYGEIVEVTEWTADNVSPTHILDHASAKSGRPCHIRLGRDIIVSLICKHCGSTEILGHLRRLVDIEKAKCPQCGSTRETNTTNVIRGTEEFASWPIARLGIPRLDILEVRSASETFWYELTGDLAQTLTGL